MLIGTLPAPITSAPLVILIYAVLLLLLASALATVLLRNTLYAIGAFADHAVFAMHRHASEGPTWTVEKRPELARKQGAFSVVNSTGQILKRGQDLAQVLKVFEKKRFGVVG